jgi:hypothetical protein
MVARETWRQRRTQPNPPRILTLEPERSEPRDSRGSDSGRSCGLRAQAACDFSCWASNASPFFHTCKVTAASLRAKVRRAISARIPFFRRFS